MKHVFHLLYDKSVMPAEALLSFSLVLWIIIIDNTIICYHNIIKLSFLLFDVTFKIDLVTVVYYLKLFQRGISFVI